MNVNVSSSVRTLILGIDRSGRIVQHDRTAPKILARSAGNLLGVHLNDITPAGHDQGAGGGPARSGQQKEAVTTLLEAVKADREGNAVLAVALADGATTEAIATARPMQADDGTVAAFVILQIPVPNAERFVDPALMRETLLRDTFTGIEDTLYFSDLAEMLL